MTSNRDKIMKKISRALAYFLVKRMRHRTLTRKEKKARKKISFKIQ